MTEQNMDDLLEEMPSSRLYPGACVYEPSCRKHFEEDREDDSDIQELEIERIKADRDANWEAFKRTFEQLSKVLNPVFSIARFWLEQIVGIKSVTRTFGGLADDGVYDIWIFLDENLLEDKRALAEAQHKMLRVFPVPDLEFSVFLETNKVSIQIPNYLSLIWSKS